MANFSTDEYFLQQLWSTKISFLTGVKITGGLGVKPLLMNSKSPFFSCKTRWGSTFNPSGPEISPS